MREVMIWIHSCTDLRYMQIVKDVVRDSVQYMSALLKGKALEVYSRLPVKDAQDYEILNDALLKRFNLTEKGFKQKFKSPRAEVDEAPTHFIARLENYLMKWIDLANVEKDFNGLMNFIVREQYLESLFSAVGHIFEREETKGFE